MFRKILIANRGEIALRIIRACKELGIGTVAIYSEADRDSLHVRFADDAVCVGPAPSSQSYLKITNLISAAEITNAEAIHPGYGFLAENARFAEICEASDIKFIGPSPTVITQMGDKAFAKETMKKAGVPIIPGSDGIVKSIQEAAHFARDFGFPIIIKAVAGGGGRGMRVVKSLEQLEKNYNSAQSEASAAFGNPDLYIEKYFENPRHIEVQLLGDNYGNAVSLGERECSIQRKHQKLIEESPSPAVDQKMRDEMNRMAIRGAKQSGYNSAGTIEFLMDEDGRYYFMEMNTRIQVEHTVTEEVFDIDLIKEQIAIAAGKKIDENFKNYKLRGHAIECRINAEDPAQNFRPSPGKITSFHTPGGFGVRVDTHAYAQYKIPPYYDSLIAKLITHGKDRAEAIERMLRALEEFVIEGVATTIPLHRAILKNERFRLGDFNTRFFEIEKITI
ncbi:acetyl-CoA carboxylase biotin carboxylase subunit [candidate division KSB1 bacterium]|nr:acetyl-CoA carboxylase biotin carboxylase subunit [candidate division KSB1 bacterium]RQW00422.1 MAG: acetyl-CoA carboxylase biotin carboxylase subunit [candidate division KSB1 bacterium]